MGALNFAPKAHQRGAREIHTLLGAGVDHEMDLDQSSCGTFCLFPTLKINAFN